MARVFVQSFGDGYCYVDNDTPTHGDTITITCIPYDDASLDEVQAWTSYDESIAIAPQALVQTITYQSAWKNVYIEAYFTGSSPSPDPPGPALKYPWLLAKAANRWRLI